MCCEGPETKHKNLVKGQGGKTNQSETSNKTMMKNSLRKEARALLCEAVQDDVYIWAVLAYIYISCIFYIWTHFVHYSGLISGVVFFNQREWRRRPWLRIRFLDTSRFLIRRIFSIEGRWYRTPVEEEIDGQDCSGIRCQIWERARVRSSMTLPIWGGVTTSDMIPCHGRWLCMKTAGNMDCTPSWQSWLRILRIHKAINRSVSCTSRNIR